MLCIWCHATTSDNHTDTCPASLNRNTDPRELHDRARDLWWKLTGALTDASTTPASEELALALETAVTQHALLNGLADQIAELRADLNAARTYRAVRPPAGLPGFDSPSAGTTSAPTPPMGYRDDEDRVHIEVVDGVAGSLVVGIDLAGVDPSRAVEVTVDDEQVYYDQGASAPSDPGLNL